jgi:hypothetical protein
MPSTDIGVGTVNTIATALCFALARMRFNQTPTAFEYTKLITCFVVVVVLIGGLTCLILPSARSNLSTNIAKFLTLTSAIASMSALTIAVGLLELPSSKLEALFWNWGMVNEDEIFAAIIPASFAGYLIIFAITYLNAPQPPVYNSQVEKLAAFAGIYMGTFAGLYCIIGLMR